ncbi:MAG: AAA family ATPase [Saccharolobus sp.]
MLLNYIKLKNFMRFKGTTTIKFNNGITIIYGKNGAGKTSIIDAIFFAFYGKTYRTSGNSASGFLSLKDLINIEEKDCEVEVGFEVNDKQYTVTRKISRTGATLAFIKEGTEQIAEGKNVEKVIKNSILGLDYDSLKNSIVIMQKEIDSYLDMTGSERKESLINLFKLYEYNNYLDKAKEYAKEIINKSKEKEIKIEDYKKLIAQEKDLLSQQTSFEETKQKSLIKEKELTAKFEELNNSLKDLENKKNELQMSLRLEKQKIFTNEKKIEELKNNKNELTGVSICPLCLQEIKNSEKILNHYNSEIEKLLSENTTSSGQIDIYNKQINDIISKENDIKEQLSDIETSLELTKEEKNKSEANSVMIKQLLKNLVQYKNNLKIEEEQLEKYHIDYEYALKLEKAYSIIPKLILERIIPALEKEASAIIQSLSNSFITEIKINKDTFKINPIVNGQMEEIQFLGGAEQMKVALALRIGISNIISRLALIGEKYVGNLRTLIIDEGDFGSLDAEGITDLTAMLSNLKQIFDKIIIITHIDEIKNTLSENTINVVKEGKYESKIFYENGQID